MATINIKFTRHALTPAQLTEIGEVHLDLTELASRNIGSRDEAKALWAEIVSAIKAIAKHDDDIHLYGVFPAPVRNQFVQHTFPLGEDGKIRANTAIYIILNESFNINRAPEGSKPSFEHLCWLVTGDGCLGL